MSYAPYTFAANAMIPHFVKINPFNTAETADDASIVTTYPASALMGLRQLHQNDDFTPSANYGRCRRRVRRRSSPNWRPDIATNFASRRSISTEAGAPRTPHIPSRCRKVCGHSETDSVICLPLHL